MVEYKLWDWLNSVFPSMNIYEALTKVEVGASGD